MKKFFVNISYHDDVDYLNGYVVIYAENDAKAEAMARLLYPKFTVYFATEEEPDS